MRKNLPILADLAGVCLYFLLLPLLIEQFKNHSIGNGILICGFYLLFCASVYLLRVSESIINPAAFTSNNLVAWSLLFSLMVSYMLFEFTGVLSFIVDTPLSEQNELMEGARGAIITISAIAVCWTPHEKSG